MLDNKLRRFLSINCVLNGRSLLLAFDNDTSLAATCLGTEEAKVSELDSALQELEVKSTSTIVQKLRAPLVASLINYFRLQEYTFIFAPQGNPFNLHTILEVDRMGKLDEALRDNILEIFRENVQTVESAELVGVRDGTIYVPVGTSSSVLTKAMLTAYEAVRDGPKKGKATLLRYRDHLKVGTYAAISPGDCRSILQGFITKKIPPTLYRDTTLFVADLYPVYEATGCLMEFSESESGGVDWALCSKKGTVYVANLSYDILAFYVGSDLKRLSTAVWDTTRASISMGD